MNIDQQKYKLSFLKNQQKQTKHDLDNKTESLIESAPLDEKVVNAIDVYDSEWVLCNIVKIDSATSQTYEELLPEKAEYNFSQILDIPEQKLPFLNINVLSKTNPEQNIQGVAEFIYTSLRELSFQLYDWQGLTAKYAPADLSPDNPHDNGYGWWTEGGDSKPPVALPDPSLAINPSPEPDSCYEKSSYFTYITCKSVGPGLGPYRLNADGTQVYIGDEWFSLSSWITQIFEIYTPGSGIINLYVIAGSKVLFIPQETNFPVPVGEDISDVLPCGSGTDQAKYSTPTYPNQYWIATDVADFADLVVIYGYAGAKAIVNKWYDDVIISDDAPYKAYETVYTDTVETAEQHKTITKLPDGKFQIDITGHLLLLSKAITETSFSDPISPTYEPSGGDMYVRLLINYDVPINYVEHEEYSR